MARNKHPEETVQRILTTASKLFLEKGYEKTSLQDIIRETGLSKGAITTSPQKRRFLKRSATRLARKMKSAFQRSGMTPR